jgi:hypothetical protein
MHGIGVWGIFSSNLFIFQLHPCVHAGNFAVGPSKVHGVSEALVEIELILLTSADA